MERSITQPASRVGESSPKSHISDEPEDAEEWDERPETVMETLGRLGRNRTLWGIAIVVLCFLAYYLIQPNRSNTYMHFVLQAQAWLDGNTSIPTPGYQDVMPLGIHADGSSCVATYSDPSCFATGYGIIPFPPLPAWLLLPFVALWHLATNQQLLAVIFAAIDVGIGYWMLGYLPVRHAIRVLTSLFLGVGTVLWYAAAIGSTWFFAHIVAVGCLLLAVGLALSADPEAAQPQPLKSVTSAVRGFRWPGGWPSVALTFAMGAVGELLFVLAGSGTPAASLAAVGVLLCLVAAALAVVVAGRPGVLVPFVLVVAVVGGIPALLLTGAQSQIAIEAIDLVLLVIVITLWRMSGRQAARMERASAMFRAAISSPESRQVAAGILFGLAVTARLTILFGFPFLILVGGGGSWMRRAMLAGAGAMVPLVTLLVITYATSGHLFNPAYDYLYQVESGYGVFAYNPDWSITDIRYIPQNLMIMLFRTPKFDPNIASIYPHDVSGTALCVTTRVRGLFSRDCPVAMPDAIGMSLILTSPAYLLAPLAWGPLRRLRVDRATVGATIAVLGIAVVNLMHFSQGWVQFGYRFSNDFVPFALVLVALGASRVGRWWPVILLPAGFFIPISWFVLLVLVLAIIVVVGTERFGRFRPTVALVPVIVLVAASILVNLWGTTWGVILGW